MQRKIYSKPRLLLVDDEPSNLKVLKLVLEETYDLIFARSGDEGLTIAAREKPDLILLDINMPVMNGWDFLYKYADLEKKREDKIVMLSSSIDYQDIKKSREFRYVTGFIEKPLTREKLGEVL